MNYAAYLTSAPGQFMLFTAVSPALYLKQRLTQLDPRLLALLCALSGICAWTMPWPALFFFVPPALVFYVAAFALLPGGRAILAAYAGFSAFWAVSFGLLQYWEHPDNREYFLQAGLIFGLRLFTLLGMALPVPLALTAIKLGRVLTWYVKSLAWLEVKFCSLPALRGKLKPKIAENAWRCGLTLVIMLSFLPRAFRLMQSLGRTLRTRAPGLPLCRRVTLLGFAALRVLSVQTWDMTIAIASRDLYRPLPWEWRTEAGL